MTRLGVESSQLVEGAYVDLIAEKRAKSDLNAGKAPG
jgi:hypothetical protein